ncbi:hypothetical protein [Hyphomicrobium sp. MC8b]|uniref:hypothetical protein n=1 Tax=Hyphomicrobium sp. MC8b TaxID=300273 RepID=UPI00391BF4FF
MEQTPHNLELADADRNQTSDEVSPTASESATTKTVFEGYTISSDLPQTLVPTRDEIALLRAFLAKEIDAILFDQDKQNPR